MGVVIVEGKGSFRVKLRRPIVTDGAFATRLFSNYFENLFNNLYGNRTVRDGSLV